MTAAHSLGNLAAWSAQAAILIVAGAAAVRTFRVRVPTVRLFYAQVLLAICLLLPALEPWRIADDGGVDIATSAAQAAAPRNTPAYPLPWRQALLIALACGCAARLAWLAVGFRRLRRWRMESRALTVAGDLDRLRNAMAPRAEFALSPTISGPVAFGLRRPLILLPERFMDFDAAAQQAIVCHELLHIRRADWIVTVAEEFIRAALWFHPAIWWLIAQIQLAREQTVDAEVVRFTQDRRQYLDALLAMAGNRPAPDLAPATLFLRQRQLKNRVALLLKEVTMTKRSLISFCAATCGVLLAAGWLALHTFPLQAAPAPQDQEKLLHSVPPKYPQAAIDKHIEGAVVVEAHIDAEGHVTDAKVLSGPEELHAAAVEAVLQWHYSPKAMTLPAITQVTLEFKLPKEGAPSTAIRGDPLSAPFTLKDIQVHGLTTSARDELLTRLPVHVGDTVDDETLRSIRQTVHAFDEHLFVLTRPGEGALTIFLASDPQSASGPKIRVGGNIQQTKLISKVNPVYPPDAKAAGIQGVVQLEAVIGKDGAVENLKVISGHPLLIPASLEAVKDWKYQITLLNGEPVEVVTQITVNYTLAP